MKSNRKYAVIIAVILYILLFFPGVFIYAATDNEAYKDGYTNGWVDGIEAAQDDSDEGKKKNYYTAMPNSSEIIDTYNLKGESNDYRTSFISGYKEGFKEGYYMTYSNPTGEKKTPENYAESIGFAIGEVNGYMDYYEGDVNKWTNAVPTTTQIIDNFILTKESNDYKNNFITTFKSKYKEGYEYGYRLAKYEPVKTAIDRGEADGEKFGAILGANYGKLDYYNGSSSQWDRDLPLDSNVKNIFLLNDDSQEYSKAFIASFKKTYREEYENAYRTANVNYNALIFEKGYTQGKDIGLVKGQSLARIDRLLGKSNNENRHNLSDSNIINEYKLFDEDEKYREGFMSGFREGTKTGYMTIYQDSNFEYYIRKVETKLVPISGAQVASGDNKLLLDIEKGTFYNDIVVSIDKLIDANTGLKLPSKDRYTKASELYNIIIVNSSDSLNRDKPIKISFEYYGPQSGGIYKNTNSGWVYLPSKVNENSITAVLNPKTQNNNNITYAVFIDSKACNIDDIRGHWAKDEIVTYLRRGTVAVYGDNTFRPDAAISRAQILTCISKIYKWNLKSTENDIKELECLDNYKEIEPYKELIAYCRKNDYLNINEDNTVRIYDPVSYREVESIMRLASGDNGFTWQNVAEKIIKYKDKRSSSYNSMDNYITRSEAIYMLYYMNE